jgi:hypothetical protein
MILAKSISRFARNTLDTISFTRELRALGIPVIFEKENINSIYPESDFLISIHGAFAQAESESISTNVRWGKRQAMKEGRAIMQYKWLLGFERGDGNRPQIVEDQAETVRYIYKRYLAGDTIRAIKGQLEASGALNAAGTSEWTTSNLRSILTNEKYCGDVLLQKTFVQDCISKKVVKNTGQLPKYFVQNHHEGIVTRDIFDAVQAEMARRKAQTATTKKSAPTGLGKYSGKHALSGILVCGECGTLYRRCVWTQKGQKRAVWRCSSRLDYGKKYCHHSPTMDEGPLRQAILAAINTVMSDKEALTRKMSYILEAELTTVPGEDMSLADIDRSIADLTSRFENLLNETGGTENLEAHVDRFKAISDAMALLKEKRGQLVAQQADITKTNQRLQQAADVMEITPVEVTEWDESIIHQLLESVKILSKEQLQVCFRSGLEITQTIQQ